MDKTGNARSIKTACVKWGEINHQKYKLIF